MVEQYSDQNTREKSYEGISWDDHISAILGPEGAEAIKKLARNRSCTAEERLAEIKKIAIMRQQRIASDRTRIVI